MFALLISCGVVIAIAAAVALGWYREHQRQIWLERNFPPISDDEFMARCPPGTNRDVALKVRRIIAEQLGYPYERIHPTSRFEEGDLLG
ncbi:hypothetical protein Psta_3621 [Pirellula staleyi DSM 6068]|uniref:Carrier domain-containing protein n=1 Tax=Pirellula staleyi (strain ATCC 27377 / DSM 6068 / ICPB 4128) TaxID=530564 RepID=D2QZ90_PIRSD|nr:hypothetical protein [Pirellula staleyi]ADB18282.1 hypothetical protein Psta_3621 [Pirellula staleyi DSM 6068]